MNNIVEKVISIAGGQVALAKLCGIRQQSVHDWLKRGRIPAARVLQIKKLIGRKLSWNELCPDIYPKK